MNPAKFIACIGVILGISIFALGQTEPNLEAGIKPYGTYHGTDIDTVNVMNGNIIVHIPFPADYPQRGNLHLSLALMFHAKGWHLMPLSGTTNEAWAPDRSLMGGADNLHPAHTRTLTQATVSGQTTENIETQALVSPDGSSHALMDVSGNGTAFETVDGSGWHISMSNPNQFNILQSGVITDRAGTQYTIPQYGAVTGACATNPDGGGLSVPPGPAPIQSPIPAPGQNTTSCQSSGKITSVVDANGNMFSMPLNAAPTDTMGKVGNYTWGAAGTVTQSANPPGCPGTYSFYGYATILHPSVNGAQNQILLCYANFPFQTSFGISGDIEYPNGAAGGGPTGVLISSIVLPDGSSWTFNYDGYGNITHLGLPLGGSISYQWATVAFPSFSGFSPVSRAVTQRTVTDNNGHSYVWKYQWLTSQSNPLTPNGTFTNVVTDPLNNDSVHIFTNFSPSQSFYETTTQAFQGSYTAGTLMQQVVTGYLQTPIGTFPVSLLGNPGGLTVLPNSIRTTVYPSGKTRLEQKTYDTGLTSSIDGNTSYGKVITEKEYDWGPGGPGALLRETDTTYKWQVNSAYLTAHMLDLPASVVVKDGAGCALSATDYTYDEPAYLTTPTPAVTTQHGAPPSGVRGNLTTVTKWLASASSCNPRGGTAIVSHTNWYDTGEAYQQIDPLGSTTTHTYDPAYVGAFPTQTCNAAGQCMSATYDFTTGLLTSFTNINATSQASGNAPGDSAHTTFYVYDLMSRLKSATFPPDPDPANGGAQAQTTFNYPFTITLPFTVTKTKSITSGLTDSVTSTYDGLGRVYKTQHPLPGGTAEVDTVYDGLDHVTSATNPYFSTSDPTYGTIQSQYDALGRVTQVTEQDGSTRTMAYNITPVQAAPGDCTQSADEAGKQRRTCTDALGRLIEVHEPGDTFSGTPSTGSLTIGGTLASQSGVGAVGATYATGSVSISGIDQGGTQITRLNPCPPVPLSCIKTVSFFDSGSVSLTVSGHTYSAAFPSSSAWNVSELATTIVNQMTSDPNVLVLGVTNSSGLATINLQARNPGSVGNSITISTSYTYNSASFSTPSFTTSPASGNLAGGTNTYSGITVYDQGNVSATVSGFTATVPYSQTGNSSATQVASALAAALSVSSSPVTANSSGTQLIVAYKNVGAAGNTSISVSSQSTQTQATFPANAFTGSGTLSNGFNTEGISLDFNYFVTQYSYDGLGDLLQVTQKGDPSVTNSSQWRVRNFTYDSLGRLLTATNPESGTITYSYDADGNLLQKTSPAPNQTGSATQTVSYCYDSLHRVTKRDYQPHTYTPPACPITSPVVSYVYDLGANAIGHLVSLTDQAGPATYGYDILGRMTAETRSIAGVSKSTGYSYNLDGSVRTLTYPSSRVVTYTPDSAGRLISAADGNGTNYVIFASYNPNGSVKSLLNGSTPALNQSFQYTPRLQMCRITALTSGTLPTSCTDTQNIGNVMDRGYDFHAGNGTMGSGSDNGNIFAITNYRDTTRSQAFTYDALNRLTSASSSANTGAYSWGENYSIDAWGNLQIAPMGSKAHGGYFPNASDTNNRPIGLTYDAAGNLTNYTSPGQYVYDQENRLSSTAGTTYTYDGNGERVLKSNTSTGAPTKRYWSMGGNTLAEADGTGNLTAEYIYFSGKRVARIDLPANTIHYYFSDHLGSTSIIASSVGGIEEESDYYSFGTEVVVTGGVNELKFTGKRRDMESQVDYFGARHYENKMGRFVSADEPFVDQDLFNPQSWNLYSYVRNNPVNATDPDGRAVLVCLNNPSGGSSCAWASDDDYKQAQKADSQLGIVGPTGDHPNGDLFCGGQVCGSVTYEPGPVSDHTGPDNGAMIPGTLGPLDVAVYGIGRSLLSATGTEAAGAVVEAGAGRGLLTATEGVLLSNGTKDAARAIVDGMAEGAQKASLKRGIAAAGSQAKVTLQKLGNGSVRVMINRAGTEGGQTIIKTVAVDGSSKTVQLAVDGAGKLVHYDPKN